MFTFVGSKRESLDNVRIFAPWQHLQSSTIIAHGPNLLEQNLR